MRRTVTLLVVLGSVAVLSPLINAEQSDDVSPYTVLGVDPSASQADIRRAFRRLSLQYHPDKHPDDPHAQSMFNTVSQAYEMIGDEEERKIYDGFGTEEFTTREAYERSGVRDDGPADKGLYGHNGPVLTYDHTAFMGPCPRPRLVKFYAPWCSHCQTLAREFKRAALLLEDEVEVGAVDCDVEVSLCQHMQIAAYPTVRLMYANTSEYETFQGGVRDAEALVEFVHRLGQAEVVPLDAATFQSVVMESNDLWVVDFHTTWCGPCRSLKPMVREVSSRLSGVVKVGMVDCDASSALCQHMQIEFYPSIRLFPRRPSQKLDMNAGRGQHLAMPRSNNPTWQLMDVMAQVLQVALYDDVVAAANRGVPDDGDAMLDDLVEEPDTIHVQPDGTFGGQEVGGQGEDGEGAGEEERGDSGETADAVREE